MQQTQQNSGGVDHKLFLMTVLRLISTTCHIQMQQNKERFKQIVREVQQSDPDACAMA
eukprot:CAMPEP_0177626404 /NCGR_PEP_ID=MMETSP0419_2-20121207/30632_1 /TAXON_ID=582737 /ORGANISM="Tetraselmis sp., Strain GSL018" /LENGTH=57 /DNA_ID=CAMNT_0019127449 /DNA_START=475 /DNA_END=645 /DNA_ORIENTATION=-